MKTKFKIYFLFIIGHIAYLINRLFFTEFLFNSYQYCMIESSNLQEKYNLVKPWKMIPSDEEFEKFKHELHSYYFADDFEGADFDKHDKQRIKFLQKQILNYKTNYK